MQRSKPKFYAALLFGGAGLFFLLLAVIRTGGLAQGSGGDKLVVQLALCGFAALSLLLIAAQGYSPFLVWAALFPVALAMFLRVLCLDHITQDYVLFLFPWTEAFRTAGGFWALKENIGNYNVPYLYFLAAVSRFRFPDLYAIKLFSIFFDLMLAWGGMRLTRILCGKESLRPLAAFSLLLLLPTVILNGSFWGQCDAIYTAFALHAFASALERKPAASVLLLAVAFSFKLQTVFLIPLWCVLWYAGRVKFRHLLLFPVGYAATIAPALLLGKPLADTLGVYAGQMGEYAGRLTMNAPSVYALIPYGVQVDTTLFSRLGIAAAFVLVLVLLSALYLRRAQLSDRALLTAAVLLAVGVPFLLPTMHERYFFMAEALTVVWACADIRRILQAACVQLASLGGYHAYLLGRYAFPLSLPGFSLAMGGEAFLMLAVLLSAQAALWKDAGFSSPRPGKIIPPNSGGKIV